MDRRRHRPTYRSALLVPCLVAGTAAQMACAECSEEDATVVTPIVDQTPSPPPDPAPPPPYEVHEWGLVAHALATDPAMGDNHAQLLAGPGLRVLTRRTVGVLRGAAGGKPILYAHLGDGVSEATFDVTVTPSSGEILEHWPPGELAEGGGSLRWMGVRAHRGECGARTYPARDSAPCLAVRDGYCEAAELAAYETPDSACLTFGGADLNHLFYRASVPIPTLAAVQRTAAGEVVVTPSDTLPGYVLRVRRDDRRDRTRVSIVRAAEANVAVSVTRAADQPAVRGIDTLRAGLRELGMTEREGDAFMRAWTDHLFGFEGTARREVAGGGAPSELRPKTDALLYWLPVSAAAYVATLTFDPPPTAVKRAILVLVDLE